MSYPELERRQRADRRKGLDAYVRGIVAFKSGVDLRSPTQLALDNAFTNRASEDWYRSHRESRHHGQERRLHRLGPVPS